MNNKLSPQVALPYRITKGTISEREAKAKRDVDKLYKNLYPYYKKNTLNSDILKRSVNKIFKNKLNISILPICNDPEFSALSDIIYSPQTEKISSTTIEIPITKTKKIFQEELISILHEFQHITDQIYQPKILARNQRLHLKGMYSNKYNNLYDNHIYHFEGASSKAEKKYILQRLKYRILHFLRGMSTEDKIDYIQDFRYSVILEDLAYKTQAKYAKILKKKHGPVTKGDLIKENKDYMFAEKIQLLTKMGFEIIKKERLKMKLKHRTKDLFTKLKNNIKL